MKPGDYIRYQDMSSRKWIPGVVKDKCEQPHSYLIVTPNGNTLRRNRQQVRGRSEQFIPRRIQVENTPENTSVAKTADTENKLEIVSRCSVSPDGTWLKRDIQSIMSNLTPPKDSGHMISYKLSSTQQPQ